MEHGAQQSPSRLGFNLVQHGVTGTSPTLFITIQIIQGVPKSFLLLLSTNAGLL
jgi:hypothetical protein